VIAEIGLIHGDGSRRIYLEQLFSQAALNTEQLKESAKMIREISSDGDKAQVLIAVEEKYFTGNLRPYLFDAAESINSDGDKGRVLSDIISKDAGNIESLVRATRAASHISSDGDKAEVLVEIADPYRASDELHMVYFEAANSISSDGDHARVLSKLLQVHGDDHDTLARVLRSAENISSDGDKARVLREAVSSYRDDQAMRKAFFDAANSISSDGDHQQVLVTLVHRQGIGTDTLEESRIQRNEFRRTGIKRVSLWTSLGRILSRLAMLSLLLLTASIRWRSLPRSDSAARQAGDFERDGDCGDSVGNRHFLRGGYGVCAAGRG